MSRLPTGACDTHIHVYDHRFPVSPTALLEPPDASLDDYARLQRELGCERVVIVQPTTYGLDNRCQLQAVGAIGDRARAVVVVDDTTTSEELERLHRAGARGARFHMLPGGAVAWGALEPVARAIAPLGWHIQLQLDGRELAHVADRLLQLPVPIVIDHIGRFMPPVAPEHDSFRALLQLVDAGACWVKLSAPYESTRQGAPTFPAVTRLAGVLVAHAPERLLWATNWPHPGQDQPPDHHGIMHLIDLWLPTDDVRRRVLVDNPVEVYGFDPIPEESS